MTFSVLLDPGRAARKLPKSCQTVAVDFRVVQTEANNALSPKMRQNIFESKEVFAPGGMCLVDSFRRFSTA